MRPLYWRLSALELTGLVLFMLRLISLGLLLAVALTGCASVPASSEAPAGPSFVYGLTLQPSGFDPHIHASSELGIPLRSVYDTLVYRDPATLDFVPGLAQSWTISDDGRAYTFSLRTDVRFHDGTPFNAAAVAANLDRITADETASQRSKFLLGPYAGYEIVDEYTIRLNLDEPYSPLLDSLSQVYLGMAGPAALSEYGLERYQFHQVGTGPYRMAEYVPGDRLVLEVNPDYAWGPSFYSGTPPIACRVSSSVSSKTPLRARWRSMAGRPRSWANCRQLMRGA